MKTITINNGKQNQTFAFKKIGQVPFAGVKLSDVYASYSPAKEQSFEYWKGFFGYGFLHGIFEDYGLFISSANTFQYTLAGHVVVNGTTYNFKITANNNYIEIA